MKRICYAVLETREGRKLSRVDDSLHGPPNELEKYYSPNGEIELLCSTDEREDCEAATDIFLPSDVLDPDQFARLCAYMTANHKLKLFGVFPKYTP